MPQATFINPKTGDRKPAEIGSRQAEDLFAADYVLEQSPGVAVQPTSPTDPRLRDLNVSPPTTPQGTGNLAQEGSGGLSVNQASTPAQQPNVPTGSGTDYSKFGSIITNLLKQQQALGTAKFQEQEFNAQREQVNRMKQTDPGLIGASPSLQASTRSADVAAVQPTVQGAQQARKTFSEQIAGLGTAIAQARGVGEWMQQVDREKQQDAIDFLYKFPAAIQELAKTDEKRFKEFAKLAGVTPEMIMAIPQQATSIKTEMITELGKQKLINSDTGEIIKEFEGEDLPSTPGSLSPEQFDNAVKLSGQLKTHPMYTDMIDIYSGMIGVISGVSQEDGFGDIAAINAFQRMVDPGATVREGDVALLQTASAWLEEIAPQHVRDKLTKGSKLPPEVRERMLKTAQDLYRVRAGNFNEAVGGQYKALAEAGSVPYNLIGQDFPATAADLSDAVPTDQSLPIPIQQLQNGNKIYQLPSGDTFEASDQEFRDNFGTFSSDLSRSENGSVAIKSQQIGEQIVKGDVELLNLLAQADAEMFREIGKHLIINQDFRTAEEQAELYNRLKGKAQVAPPGKSFHESGKAVDVTNWREAQPYMNKYGLLNKLDNDKGHFSLGEFT